MPPEPDQDSQAQLEALRLDYEDTQSRASELETQLKAAEQDLEARMAKIQELETASSQVLASLDEEKAQGEGRIRTLEQELEESQLLAQTLKETITGKETAEREGGEKLKAKLAEIASLEFRLQQTQTEFDEERQELGEQVDELRQAGQVCILSFV